MSLVLNRDWPADCPQHVSDTFLTTAAQAGPVPAPAPRVRPRREAATEAFQKFSQLYAPAMLSNDLDLDNFNTSEPVTSPMHDSEDSDDSDAYIEPDLEPLRYSPSKYRKRKRLCSARVEEGANISSRKRTATARRATGDMGQKLASNIETCAALSVDPGESMPAPLQRTLENRFDHISTRKDLSKAGFSKRLRPETELATPTARSKTD